MAASVLETRKDEVNVDDVGRWLERAKNGHHESITTIDLPSKRIGMDELALLGTLFMHCPGLRSIRLRGNEIRDEGAVFLATLLTLEPPSRLSHLDLSANGLTAPGAVAVARAFLERLLAPEAQPAEPLLDLSDNCLGDGGVSEVAQLLGGQVGLRLRLRGVGCTRGDLNELLKHKGSLSELDLASNPIGTSGTVAVCSAALATAGWHTLGLARVRGGAAPPPPKAAPNSDPTADFFVDTLVECVRNARGLTALDLSGNGLGDGGCAQLVEAVGARAAHGSLPLRRLSLCSNGCGRQTAEALQRVLAGSDLRELRLEDNALDDEAAEKLADGLARSTSLEQLCLSYNAIGDRGAEELARGLRSQCAAVGEAIGGARGGGQGGREVCCLRDLWLSGNPVGDRCARALASAASAAPEAAGLERLWLADLRGKGVLHAGLEALRAAVAARAAAAGEVSRRLDSQDSSTSPPPAEAGAARVQGRPPAALEVFGLPLSSPGAEEAAGVRPAASARTRELGPGPAAAPAGPAPATAAPQKPPAGGVRVLPLALEAEGAAPPRLLNAFGAPAKAAPPSPLTPGAPQASGRGHGGAPLADQPASSSCTLRAGRSISGVHAHEELFGGAGAGGVAAAAKPSAPKPAGALLGYFPSARMGTDVKLKGPSGRSSLPPVPCQVKGSVHVSSSCASPPHARRGTDREPESEPGSPAPGGKAPAPSRAKAPTRPSAKAQASSRDSEPDVAAEGLADGGATPPGGTGASIEGGGEHPGGEGAAVASEAPPPKAAGKSKGKGPPPPGPPGGPPLAAPAAGKGGKGKGPPAPPKASSKASAKGQPSSRESEPTAGEGAADGGTASPSGTGDSIEGGGEPPGIEGAAVASEAPPPKAASKGKGKGPPQPVAGGKASGKSKGPPPPGSTPPPSSPPGGKASGKSKGPPPPGSAPPLSDPPEAEPAAGKGGKGKGPGGPSGGKAPPLAKAKAWSKASAKARPSSKEGPEARAAGAAPFGRRIHLAGAKYDEPEGHSVFNDLDEDVGLDTDMITGMFSNAAGKGVKAAQPASKKKEGIKVLDLNRAQSIAIMLSRLPVPPEELCEQLQRHELADPRMDPDSIEILMEQLPNKEEAEKLLKHEAEVEELRDVEQKIFPFVRLPRCVPLLRLMKLGKTHSATASKLLQRCEVLRAASEEVRSSRPLRFVFRAMLKLINYINHGTKDIGKGTMRSFPIESLNALATFKVGQASGLQILAFTTRKNASSKFLQSLKQSLSHVQQAAKEKTADIKQGVGAFSQELTFAKGQVAQLEEGSPARERLEELVREVQQRVAELNARLDAAQSSATEAQAYFGVGDGKSLPPPPEELFGHFEAFLANFETAWLELDKHPFFKEHLRQAPEGAGPGRARTSRPKALSRRRTVCAERTGAAREPDGGAKRKSVPFNELGGPADGAAGGAAAPPPGPAGAAPPGGGPPAVRLTASALGAAGLDGGPAGGAGWEARSATVDDDGRSELGSCLGSIADVNVHDLVNDIFDLAGGDALDMGLESGGPPMDKTLSAPATPTPAATAACVVKTPSAPTSAPGLAPLATEGGADPGRDGALRSLARAGAQAAVAAAAAAPAEGGRGHAASPPRPEGRGPSGLGGSPARGVPSAPPAAGAATPGGSPGSSRCPTPEGGREAGLAGSAAPASAAAAAGGAAAGSGGGAGPAAVPAAEAVSVAPKVGEVVCDLIPL